jgi:hypothetical protein
MPGSSASRSHTHRPAIAVISGRGVIVEAIGKLGKIGDNEITSRIWYRVGRTGWTPFSGTTDKRGPVTFPAGRI